MFLRSRLVTAPSKQVHCCCRIGDGQTHTQGRHGKHQRIVGRNERPASVFGFSSGLNIILSHPACAVVGVNYTPAGSFPVSGITVNYTQHFSGNVWWTSATHWHSLPEQVSPSCPARMFGLSHRLSTV